MDTKTSFRCWKCRRELPVAERHTGDLCGPCRTEYDRARRALRAADTKRRDAARRARAEAQRRAQGLLLTEEAAALLGIRPESLRVQLWRGAVSGIRRGKRYYITAAEVERYRVARTVHWKQREAAR